MNVYIKGAVGSLLLIAGALYWFSRNEHRLPVHQAPEHYALINRMEREGVTPFQLPRVDGTPFDLKSVQGKVVILNFWASWCNPCVQEFPSLIQLVERFKGEIVLVAVSTDENKADMEAFLKAFGLPKPGIEILWDKDRAIANSYGVGKIPESFLIGRDMKLIRKVIGIDNWFTPDAVEFFADLIEAKKPVDTGPSPSRQ